MSGQIRGLHDVEGQLYAVSGSTLYRITNQGVAIPLGQIPGVGRVSMAHNQVAGGHQLTVVNGVGGYVWNTADQTFTIITDEGYPGSSRVDFIDGYMMHVEPFGRFLLHSDLADALDFNTLDRFEAETQPDKTVSLIVNGSEVWAFGERTIDVFANVGTAQGTFQNKKVGITTGCIAAATPAVVDAGAAWLGDDRVVYHARGYSPTRISTRALEVELSKYSLSDIRNAFSFVYADRGHTIYYLTIPNGMTFGYDFSTGLWHRRSSWHPEKDIYGRWCLSDLVRSNGRWIGGDYRTGKLYVLDWDYPLEGCDPLIRERTTPVAHNDGARFTLDEVELLFDTGGPETVPVEFPYQPVGPTITGNAPDGEVGAEYEFTYTVTPGTAAIARTIIRSGTMLPGLSWDELTATISGTPTASGTMDLEFRALDANGLYDDHEDEITVSVILAPQMGDWRYFQTTNEDETDYSAPEFDDSEWLTGTAPFGGWEAGYGPSQIAQGAPTGFNDPPLYDSRFATEFGVDWGVHTRLWLRRTLVLSEVPAVDVRVILYIEDHATVYINGNAVISSPPDHSGGTGQSFLIPAESFSVGENVLALDCADEADGSGISVVYVDMIMELS